MNRLLILKLITTAIMAAIIVLGLYYFVKFDMTPTTFIPPPGMHAAASLNATTTPPPVLNATKFALQALYMPPRGSSIWQQRFSNIDGAMSGEPSSAVIFTAFRVARMRWR